MFISRLYGLVLSVIIVACSVFISMCLFVLVNCLLNVLAICVGEMTVLSVRVYWCCNEVCGTLVDVFVLLIRSEIN